MPEGHTIHRIARDQATDLVGHPIGASTIQERFASGAARIDGQVLQRVEAWGKHLFLWWDEGDVLHVHLGLIGKWRRRPADTAPRGQMRLRLLGPERAWDLSGAIICALVSPDERDAVVSVLGPDPLRRDADPERFRRRVQRSRKAVGALIMEQDVIAGIGNVYRSEVLNIVGIDPRRPGREVSDDELGDLWSETVRQLRLGVRRNKIVTMSAVELGKPASKARRGEGLFAYHRETCGRCGTPLDVYALAGRRTWSCPTCQPR